MPVALFVKRLSREPSGGIPLRRPTAGAQRDAMATTHLPQTAAPPLMLERETELATLEALLAAARDGEGRLVVVEGSAGIGKTRLLAETRKLAERDGVRGARLRAAASWRASSRSGSSGSCSRLLSLPRHADVRAELLSGAAGLSASLFMSAPTTASRRRRRVLVRDAARPLLARSQLRLAQRRRCSSWTTCTGPTSRRCAGSPTSLTGSTGCRFCCLLGTRPAEQANLPALVTELLADPGAVAIRPGSLGEASAATLARERLAAEPDPVFAAALQTGSGGNPLFLIALLDALSREGISPTADQASYVIELGPQAIARGIATRLARLPVEAAQLLRAAATLGDRTELPLAAVLADLEPKVALSAASALVTADLLRHENPLEFIHPVVRTAVLEGMSAARASARASAGRRGAARCGSAARAVGCAPPADDSGSRLVRGRDVAAGGGPVTCTRCAAGGCCVLASRTCGAAFARRRGRRALRARPCRAQHRRFRSSGAPRPSHRRDRRCHAKAGSHACLRSCARSAWSAPGGGRTSPDVERPVSRSRSGHVLASGGTTAHLVGVRPGAVRGGDSTGHAQSMNKT